MKLRNRIITGLATAVLGASVLAVAPFASAEPNKMLPAPDRAVAGRYVIVLQDNAAPGSVDAIAAELAGGKANVAATYKSALKGFAARINAARAKKIAADPRVSSVIQDGKVSVETTRPIPAPPNSPWGLNRIDQRNIPPNAAGSYSYWANGTGTHIYVIDTGVRTSHVQFGARATFDFTASGLGSPGVDCHGHGTHVAGTAAGATYGVANNARVHAIKVLDCSGSGLYSQVIEGVDFVTANAPTASVANMSLGGGAFTPLDVAVNNSIEQGVTYTLSAGNSDDDACNYSPARTLSAITVGSSGNYENSSAPISDMRSSFSNWGQCLDIFAPGAHILSSYNASNTATATFSGTSMAAPHVAGVAALYLQKAPTATATQVRNGLVFWSTKNKVTNPGTGSPNRLLWSGTVSTLTANATPEPVAKGGNVTTAGVLKAEGVGLANRTVTIWFDPAGAAPAVFKGSDATSATGVYTLTAKQTADGTWIARYAGAPMVAASSASDFVDCSNC